MCTKEKEIYLIQGKKEKVFNYNYRLQKHLKLFVLNIKREQIGMKKKQSQQMST